MHVNTATVTAMFWGKGEFTVALIRMCARSRHQPMVEQRMRQRRKRTVGKSAGGAVRDQE